MTADNDDMTAFEAALPPEEREAYREFRRAQEIDGADRNVIRAEYAGRTGYPDKSQREEEHDAWTRGRGQQLPDGV